MELLLCSIIVSKDNNKFQMMKTHSNKDHHRTRKPIIRLNKIQEDMLHYNSQYCLLWQDITGFRRKGHRTWEKLHKQDFWVLDIAVVLQEIRSLLTLGPISSTMKSSNTITQFLSKSGEFLDSKASIGMVEEIHFWNHPLNSKSSVFKRWFKILPDMKALQKS